MIFKIEIYNFKYRYGLFSESKLFNILFRGLMQCRLLSVCTFLIKSGQISFLMTNTWATVQYVAWNVLDLFAWFLLLGCRCKPIWKIQLNTTSSRHRGSKWRSTCPPHSAIKLPHNLSVCLLSRIQPQLQKWALQQAVLPTAPWHILIWAPIKKR